MGGFCSFMSLTADFLKDMLSNLEELTNNTQIFCLRMKRKFREGNGVKLGT